MIPPKEGLFGSMGEEKHGTYVAGFKIRKAEKHLKPGKSQSEFCRESGIDLTAFRNWTEGRSGSS